MKLQEKRDIKILHKAARLTVLALLLEKRKPGRPKKREFDTKALAEAMGVSQRSIQRDIHLAEQVRRLARCLSV